MWTKRGVLGLTPQNLARRRAVWEVLPALPAAAAAILARRRISNVWHRLILSLSMREVRRLEHV